MTDSTHILFPIPDGIVRSIKYNDMLSALTDSQGFIITIRLKEYHVCIPKLTIGILNETKL